jgi:hypothetical protein
MTDTEWVQIDFGRSNPHGGPVWVCSSECETAYLAGWGDYMFQMMMDH